MAFLLLDFYAIQSRNEPMKRSILWHAYLSNCQVSWWRKWKKTEVKMYIYIHRSYENLPCMNWAKTESILTILKISVKTKLYSKLLSKNYIDYFSLHTYFLKNQKVILSCNRDFCNFKLKFSANWHKSLIHY